MWCLSRPSPPSPAGELDPGGLLPGMSVPRIAHAPSRRTSWPGQHSPGVDHAGGGAQVRQSGGGRDEKVDEEPEKVVKGGRMVVRAGGWESGTRATGESEIQRRAAAGQGGVSRRRCHGSGGGLRGMGVGVASVTDRSTPLAASPAAVCSGCMASQSCVGCGEGDLVDMYQAGDKHERKQQQRQWIVASRSPMGELPAAPAVFLRGGSCRRGAAWKGREATDRRRRERGKGGAGGDCISETVDVARRP